MSYSSIYTANFRDYEGNLIEVTLSRKSTVPVVDTLTISPSTLTIDWNTEYYDFTVTTNRWNDCIFQYSSTTISKIEKIGSSTARVYFKNNTTTSNRTITFAVMFDDMSKSRSVQVTQGYNDVVYKISSSTKYIEVAAEGGTYQMNFVVSPAGTEVIGLISEEDDWVTYNPTTKVLTFAENHTVSDRSTTVTFYLKDHLEAHIEVGIMQDTDYVDYYLNVSPTAHTVDYHSGFVTFNYETNGTVSVYQDDDSWVDIVSTADGKCKLELAENVGSVDRTQNVTLYLNEKPDIRKTYTITQKKPLYLWLSKDSLDVPQLGNDEYVTITASSYDYVYVWTDYVTGVEIQKPSWITVSKQSNTSLKFSTTPNFTAYDRRVKVTVWLKDNIGGDYAIRNTLSIVQSGEQIYLSLDKNELAYPYLGGDLSVTVSSSSYDYVLVWFNSNGYEIEKPSWITATQVSDGLIKFSTTPNWANENRQISVKIWLNGYIGGSYAVNNEVSISQSNDVSEVYLYLNKTNLTYGYEGGDAVVTVNSSSNNWVYQWINPDTGLEIQKPSWITVTRQAENSIRFSATENTGTDVRTVKCKVWISGLVGQNYATTNEITIAQAYQGTVVDMKSDVYLHLHELWYNWSYNYLTNFDNTFDFSIYGVIDGENFFRQGTAEIGTPIRLDDLQISVNDGNAHTLTINELHLINYNATVNQNCSIRLMVGYGYDNTYPTIAPENLDYVNIQSGVGIRFDYYYARKTFKLGQLNDEYNSYIIILPNDISANSLMLMEESQVDMLSLDDSDETIEE